jgi:hypothetical protein
LDILDWLRRAEPIAVMASLTLVIAAFSFGNNLPYPIYSNSVISSFMFIISLFFYIGFELLQHNTKLQSSLREHIKEEFRILVLKIPLYGCYIFLSLGFIYLLAVALEFGKEQLQILSHLKTFFFLFLTFILLYLTVKAYSQKGDLLKPKNIVGILGITYFLSFVIVYTFDAILESVYGSISFDLTALPILGKYVLPLLGIMTFFFIMVYALQVRRIVYAGTPRNRAKIVSANVIAAFFILMLLTIVPITIWEYLKLFDVVNENLELTTAFWELTKQFQNAFKKNVISLTRSG